MTIGSELVSSIALMAAAPDLPLVVFEHLQVIEQIKRVSRCSVPKCGGIRLADPAFREALWARYFMARPRPRTASRCDTAIEDSAQRACCTIRAEPQSPSGANGPSSTTLQWRRGRRLMPWRCSVAETQRRAEARKTRAVGTASGKTLTTE